MSAAGQNHPTFRQAPASGGALRVTHLGEAHDAPMRFFLWRDVLDELRYAASWDAARPCLAVLTGLYGLAEDGPFMEMTGFEGLSYLDDLSDERALLRALREVMETLLKERVGSSEPLSVGLFAHLPGSQAALPASIARLHLSLCNVPFQAMLVMDAREERAALYARRPRGPFFAASVHCVAQVSAANRKRRAR